MIPSSKQEQEARDNEVRRDAKRALEALVDAAAALKALGCAAWSGLVLVVVLRACAWVAA